jgi:hypothetical protein
MIYELRSAPALLQGEAQRISSADKSAMALKAQPAILRATIQITRAATGKAEEYEIVGTAD